MNNFLTKDGRIHRRKIRAGMNSRTNRRKNTKAKVSVTKYDAAGNPQKTWKTFPRARTVLAGKIEVLMRQG